MFGGIAGVVHSSEQPIDAGDFGRLPSIDVKSREIADMQDMYRRTLAASWSSRAGDLPADKLIEELFAGSTCWNNEAHNANADLSAKDHRDSLSPETTQRQSRSGKMLSPSFERRRKSSSSNRSRNSSKTPDSLLVLGHSKKGGSIEQQLYEGVKSRGWKTPDTSNELSEFDVREDLRSWEVVHRE